MTIEYGSPVIVVALACATLGCEPRPAAPAAAARAAAVEPAPAIPVDPATIATALVAIPATEYRPLMRAPDEPESVTVPAFSIERHAVTNGQFAAFVGANPAWRRSRVARLFADDAYLAHWVDDVDPGPGIDDRPVTFVSWFAARAYAKWIGRRLPTVAEWEAVGAASETAVYGREEPEFARRILDWYGRPTPAAPQPVGSGFVNVFGVADMHGLIWEWVDDFNTALVTGESRGDTGLERNLFCGAGSIGSVDPSDYAAFMRYAFRSSLSGGYAVRNLGFRCAAERGHKE